MRCVTSTAGKQVNMKAKISFGAVALLLLPLWTASAAGQTNGQLMKSAAGVQVWHAQSGTWATPEDFWVDYATNASGKFWGRSAEYPPYAEVNEHDTLLIEADGGPCLMYFFHQRWRRAQDVRRWDPGFNDILGCPRVFD